jgi:hypothetical protein
MRAILNLVIALLMILVFASPAGAQQASAPSAVAIQSDAVDRPSGDAVRPAESAESARHFSVRPDESGIFDKDRDELLQRGKTTCYTIRSYVFLRERGSSDTTRLAGETTCTPSSRFQLKSAVRLVHADSR